MKIYIFDERTGGALRDICVSNRAEVLTHEEAMSRRKHINQGLSFLDEVDLLILEVTSRSQDVQFILAHALLLQKPTLCLYVKNSPPRDVMSYVRKQPYPRSIKTFSYTSETMPLAVRRFMGQHATDPYHREELPATKYTLRLTPRDDKYLQWLAKQHHTTKAKMLRHIIHELIEKDDAYREVYNGFEVDEESDRLSGF